MRQLLYATLLYARPDLPYQEQTEYSLLPEVSLSGTSLLLLETASFLTSQATKNAKKSKKRSSLQKDFAAHLRGVIKSHAGLSFPEAVVLWANMAPSANAHTLHEMPIAVLLASVAGCVYTKREGATLLSVERVATQIAKAFTNNETTLHCAQITAGAFFLAHNKNETEVPDAIEDYITSFFNYTLDSTWDKVTAATEKTTLSERVERAYRYTMSLPPMEALANTLLDNSLLETSIVLTLQAHIWGFPKEISTYVDDILAHAPRAFHTGKEMEAPLPSLAKECLDMKFTITPSFQIRQQTHTTPNVRTHAETLPVLTKYSTEADLSLYCRMINRMMDGELYQQKRGLRYIPQEAFERAKFPEGAIFGYLLPRKTRLLKREGDVIYEQRSVCKKRKYLIFFKKHGDLPIIGRIPIIRDGQLQYLAVQDDMDKLEQGLFYVVLVVLFIGIFVYGGA